MGGTLSFLDKQVHDDKRREMLVMIRGDEYSQQLGASEAIIAASSKKKDVATIVSQGIAVVKYPYQGDNEHIKGGPWGVSASWGPVKSLRGTAWRPQER